MRGCGGAGFQRACLLCGSKQNEVFWWRYGWARTRFHGRWEAASQFACHKCLLRSNHRHVFHVSASGCPVAWLCEFDCPLFPHILNWRQGSWDGWQCGNLVVLLSYVFGKTLPGMANARWRSRDRRDCPILATKPTCRRAGFASH